MQKAKHRTKFVSVPAPSQNSNGFHKPHEWVPGDPVELHPLYRLAGSHKDDPTWDEYVQLMKNLRREELERDLKNLEGEL